MTREEIIRNLKYTMEKHKNDRVDTFDTNISAMCKDILDYLEQEPRKGRWIKTPKAVMGEGYMWYCDKCKHQVYQDSSRDYPSEKFCPSCGSDNREMEELKTLEIVEVNANYYVNDIILTAHIIDVNSQWYFDKVINQMKKRMQEREDY